MYPRRIRCRRAALALGGLVGVWAHAGPGLDASAAPAAAPPAAPATAAADDLDAEWKRQFDDLARQLQERDWFAGVAGQSLRRDALILPADRDPVDVVVRRAEALLADILRLGPKYSLDVAAQSLRALAARAKESDPRRADSRYALFVEACRLRRTIALANPLLDFRDILFIKRHGTTGRHACKQFAGMRARPGGSVYVLRDAWGQRPSIHDVLAGSVVTAGRLKGKPLEPGAYVSLALSDDAKMIYFAYTERKGSGWDPGSCFHIFRAGVDGGGLAQLTDGPWNDFDPCPLPNGRVAFLSERRGGVGRCHYEPLPTHTLHSMNPDGGDIVCLSYHETDEWNPSVTHDGRIVYSRWDYVDRGDCIAHHPWITTPDGRDARAIHGNYPRSATKRPFMEAYVRPIPGSDKFVAVACAHHDASLGSLVLIDAGLPDDDAMSQVKRITPEVRFPESECYAHDDNIFSTPWPLSENYYLAAYAQPDYNQKPPSKRQAERHGIYLVDGFGNRELIHRDPELRCWNPIPLKARPRPPVLPHQTAVGLPPSEAGGVKAARPAASAGGACGEVAVVNVYDGLKPWPPGTAIKALRIVQVFPKPKSAPDRAFPPIGRAYQALARGVLGTVPVEADGSAHFLLPAGKAVYFQALDDKGLAVQSMMSDVYVHPGERLVCQGCHEQRMGAPANPRGVPLALRRLPSRVEPDVDGSWPLTFPRLVQPVLDRKCVACHLKSKGAPPMTAAAGDAAARGQWPPAFAKAYQDLTAIGKRERGWSPAFVALQQRSLGWHPTGPRSTPGQVGARASGLWRLLDQGHHDVQLSGDERHRIALWLDTGCNFYGAYHDLEAQARGERVEPEVQ
jgi:hypothetical protein